MPDTNKTLIAVSGPTAIGKTALAIKLASYFNTEIISADSRQFYKEMTIGTAVPDKDELTAAPHHFIQHKSIHEAYNVGDYEKDVLEKIDLLFQKHDIVILVGGSGLYVKSVLEGLDEFPEIDPEIRKELQKTYEQEGISALQQLLLKHDALYYQKVDKQNPQRLIRALEVCIQTNRPYSSFLNKNRDNRSFNYLHLALNAPREVIYERINVRVEKMMAQGLLQEARKLYRYKELNALQTVGYKELFQYFDGKISLDFAISEIKKNSRRYAKRQLTWLRKDPSVLWINYDLEFKILIEQIKQQLYF